MCVETLLSSIIEIETILFHQTICLRYQGMQYYKQYIYLTSLPCKIQNGRHEITEVNISSLLLFFRNQGMQ